VLSVLILGFWAGCAAPDQEIDLASFNSTIDQRLIARYYQEEAFRYRQQADELDARGDLYERMDTTLRRAASSSGFTTRG
jgi:hypothetical protein